MDVETHNKLKNICYENNETIKDVLDRSIERYIKKGGNNGNNRN